jgi:hypothetical protein
VIRARVHPERFIAGRARDLLLLLALVLPGAAAAHPLAPGLLELTEVAPERYAVLWRTSVARAGSAGVEPRLPAPCERRSEPEPRVEAGEALVARWLVRCAGGLEGRALAVDGLDGSGINVIVRVVPREAPAFQALLGADQPAVTVSFDAASPVFTRYLRLGAEHLAGGLDHLLFLLGLFLLVTGLGRLIAAVTAFTVGHSITLALATFGLAPLSQDVAEVLIAATVLALAVELARRALPGTNPAGSRSPSPKNRTVLFSGNRSVLFFAGGFGLVHGLGFAGALREAGLPAGEAPLALLGFNLGIELAQLALVALLLVAAAAWRRLPAPPRWAPLAPAYITGSLAACWLLERAATLLA